MPAKASVIIPAFNAESFIEEAIESVLKQTWPSVECVVVDDGSTDGTVSRVERFGDRVILVRQPNLERSVARNKGVASSSGEYVSFLDADDYIAPDKVEKQLNFLEEHLEYALVYSDAGYFSDNGGRRFSMPKRNTPSGDVVSELIYGNLITINSPLIRRKAFERCGGFDPEFSHYEDWDMLLRLALTESRFGYVEGCHAFCRRHELNTDRDRLRMKEGKLRAAEKIVAQFSQELQRRGICENSVLAFHRADYGRSLIMSGRVAEGSLEIRRASRFPFPARRLFQFYSKLAILLGPSPLRAMENLLERWKGALNR